MGQLFENDLKVGDPIIYNGLGTNRKAIIIKRTKRTITFKCAHSTVKLTFISGVPAADLGIRRDITEIDIRHSRAENTYNTSSLTLDIQQID